MGTRKSMGGCSRKSVLALAIAASAAVTLATQVRATDYYFDVNGGTPGSGVTNGSTYDWLYNAANWTTDSTGSSPTITPSGGYSYSSSNVFGYSGHNGDGDNAIFVANSDAGSSSFTVNANGALGVHNITVNSGNVTINETDNFIVNGDNNNLTGTWNVASGSSLTIGGNSNSWGAVNMDGNTVVVTGGGNISVAGMGNSGRGLTLDNNFTGTMTITGSLSYSGTTTINSGTLAIQENLTGNGSDYNWYWGVQQTIINAGGTLSINSHSHIHNLTLNGGTLASSAVDQFHNYGSWVLDDVTYVTGSTPSTISAQQVGINNGTFDVAGGSTLNVTGTLVGGSTLTKNNSGTMALSGSNSYTGGTVVNGGTLVLQNSSTTSPAFAINNASTLRVTGSFWFNGSGGTTFTFDSNGGGTIDTTSGTNFINNGGMTFVTNGGATNNITGSSGINLNGNNASFNLTRGSGSSDLTVSGPIWNSGSITVNGNGVLTLVGNNTYSGTTTVNGGTLRFVNTAPNSSNSLFIAGGSTLEFYADTNVSTVDSANVALGANGGTTVTGSGTFLKTGSGVLALDGQFGGHGVTFNMSGGTIDIEAGTLRNGGWDGGYWGSNHASMSVAGGALFDIWGGQSVTVDALNGGGTIDSTHYGSGQTLTVGINNGSGNFSGTYQNTSGSLGLIKVGNGTQTLSGPNTYSGGTTVSGGTLILQNTVTGSANFTVNSPGTLNFNITSGQFNLMGGTIDGNGTLIKSGGGNLLLGGYNGSPVSQTVAMTGGLIDVQGGTLRNEWGNSAWSSNLAALEVDSGATYDTWDGNTTVDSITGSGTINKGWGGNSTLTIGVNNGGGTFTGNITNTSGSLALVKNGNGTQVLAGSNTYSGGTAVNGGSLEISGSGTLGGGNYSGNISLASNIGATLVYASSADQTFSGAITTGPNGGTLVQNGPGTLTLAGGSDNSYLNVTVNSGTIVLDKTVAGQRAAFAFTIAGGTAQIASTATTNQFFIAPVMTGGTLDLNGTSQGADSGATAIAVNAAGAQIINSNISSPATWTGGIALSANATLGGAGNLTIGNAITDGGAGYGITKTGSGVLTLTASNPYSGGTNVNAGTVLVNGSLSNAANAVTVGAGGTLGGSGTIAGTVAINNNGTISPGTGGSPATLTTGSQTWNAGGIYIVNIGWPGSGIANTGTPGHPDFSTASISESAVAGQDLLLVSTGGTIQIDAVGGTAPGSRFIIDLAPKTGLTGNDAFIVANASKILDSHGQQIFPGTAAADLTDLFTVEVGGPGIELASGQYDVSVQSDIGGGYDIVVTPEPGSLGLLGLTALGLLRRRRANRGNV